MHRLESLVASSAEQFPERMAVKARGSSWTYRELDSWANRTARWLKSFGVGPGDRVAIWAPKSCSVIACMQGILRLGAAYVPIDPAAPLARAQAIASDCNVRLLVSEGRAALDISAQVPGYPVLTLGSDIDGPTSWSHVGNLSDAPLPPVEGRSESDLAYILYTSGSTGTPKGVCISHLGALAFVSWAVKVIDPTSSSVFSNHAPLNFDLSVLDLHGAFACGALVTVIPEGSAYSAGKLVEFLVNERVTIWYSVPSALILMMEFGGLLATTAPALRVLIFAGEPFPIKHLRKLRQHLDDCRFFNFYGPTETNVCTSYEVEQLSDSEDHGIPIGIAASGDEVWIQRDDGERAVLGEEGVLWVEGPTVMLGYWGREPQVGPYSTGDLCRARPDGNSEYVGRRDQMVKLRGYRVELGEIEAVLSAHPLVREVAVAVLGAGVESKLFAFLTTEGAETPSLISLKTFSARQLPSYMLIDQVQIVDTLPRTQNGKLDRRALAALVKPMK